PARTSPIWAAARVPLSSPLRPARRPGALQRALEAVGKLVTSDYTPRQTRHLGSSLACRYVSARGLLARGIRQHKEPSRSGRSRDAGEVRLWPFGAVLGVGFLAAVLGLAGLTWLAWALLHHPKVSHTGVVSVHDAVGVLQLVFASVAGAGALVALIVAYR